MTQLSPFKRRMMDIQGYEQVEDKDFGDVARWMKFPFFVCAAICAVALITKSIPLLWVLTALAGVAAISPVHPADLLYNYGVRFLTGTGPLLRRSGLNRAACALATVWLLATLAADYAGMTLVFYLLGWSLVAVAGLVGTTDVCIPSYVFRTFIGFPPKREAAPEKIKG